MTHTEEDMRRIAELRAAFMLLNDKGKESALAVLRALHLAQYSMDTDACAAGNTGRRQLTRDP